MSTRYIVVPEPVALKATLAASDLPSTKLAELQAELDKLIKWECELTRSFSINL